jgi:hypothetical protein
MNPIRQFMRERMVRVKDALTPLREIAFQFNNWNTGSKNFGIKYVGKLLRACGHKDGIKEAKVKGRVLTCLMGWRLVPAVTNSLAAKQTTGQISETGLEIFDADEVFLAEEPPPIGDEERIE